LDTVVTPQAASRDRGFIFHSIDQPTICPFISLPSFSDHTTADAPEALSITPIANLTADSCQFLSQDRIKVHRPGLEICSPAVGQNAFFQTHPRLESRTHRADHTPSSL